MPERYVRIVKDTHKDAMTQVNTRVGVTGKITVRVGLHQGSSMSPSILFDMILDVMGHQRTAPCCMPSSTRRSAMNIKTQICNVAERDSKESEDIPISRINITHLLSGTLFQFSPVPNSHVHASLHFPVPCR